ncbi:uncharacterized protein BJX67DRAFT_144126 [Aspergillus lucknowensis]|uniref:Transmembrane protein n=1 Tax=Aspergillus lucknowensis TaxID=176173 RepID=A0ABR4LP14_9EURO
MFGTSCFPHLDCSPDQFSSGGWLWCCNITSSFFFSLSAFCLISSFNENFPALSFSMVFPSFSFVIFFSPARFDSVIREYNSRRRLLSCGPPCSSPLQVLSVSQLCALLVFFYPFAYFFGPLLFFSLQILARIPSTPSCPFLLCERCLLSVRILFSS